MGTTPGRRATLISACLAAVSLLLPAAVFATGLGPGSGSSALTAYTLMAYAALVAALLGPVFGLAGVVRSAGKPKAWLVLGVSVVCSVIAVPLSIVIGLGSAWRQ